MNTGHAATAYFGAIAGVETISGALSDDAIAARVAAALEETSALLVAKHGLDPADLASYRETILRRFRNPALPDTVWRVGRQPLRKLSRHERFVGPAAEAAERGLPVDALVAAMGAALAFDDAEDAQSVDLQRMLREQDAASVTSSVTGLEPDIRCSPGRGDRGGAAGRARVAWRGTHAVTRPPPRGAALVWLRGVDRLRIRGAKVDPDHGRASAPRPRSRACASDAERA